MWVGIDDTDSLDGGCTTYLGALICRRFNVVEYPLLVRLNPNIPYKTRGNGAIAVNLREDGDSVKDFVIEVVEKHGRTLDENTNPGVVFISEMDAVKKRLLHEFYLKAVSQLTTIREADRLASEIKADVCKFNNGRGVIGALAALGCSTVDRTYELIAYRSIEAKGQRMIDRNSVFEMNARTYPMTYDNIDMETGRVLITPRGPDPVFSGIRGETPKAVEAAWSMVRPLEEIPLTQVFETNQGTDSHIRSKRISEVKPYDCVAVHGVVTTGPRVIEGGHVVFGVSDDSGVIWCASYEPTGGFRRVAMGLAVGDVVDCLGGVGKYRGTVNLEKIFVSRVLQGRTVVVPNCCGKKMTSAGKNKGYKCRKCGKIQRNAKTIPQKRDIAEGWYEVPPRARRHLSRPLVRQTQGFNIPDGIVNDD